MSFLELTGQIVAEKTGPAERRYSFPVGNLRPRSGNGGRNCLAIDIQALEEHRLRVSAARVTATHLWDTTQCRLSVAAMYYNSDSISVMAKTVEVTALLPGTLDVSLRGASTALRIDVRIDGKNVVH
jgi:hypothetical protein